MCLGSWELRLGLKKSRVASYSPYVSLSPLSGTLVCSAQNYEQQPSSTDGLCLQELRLSGSSKALEIPRIPRAMESCPSPPPSCQGHCVDCRLAARGLMSGVPGGTSVVQLFHPTSA